MSSWCSFRHHDFDSPALIYHETAIILDTHSSVSQQESGSLGMGLWRSSLKIYMGERIMVFSSTSGTYSNSWSLLVEFIWNSRMALRHFLSIRSLWLYHLITGEICTAEKVNVLDVFHVPLWICVPPVSPLLCAMTSPGLPWTLDFSWVFQWNAVWRTDRWRRK